MSPEVAQVESQLYRKNIGYSHPSPNETEISSKEHLTSRKTARNCCIIILLLRISMRGYKKIDNKYSTTTLHSAELSFCCESILYFPALIKEIREIIHSYLS